MFVPVLNRMLPVTRRGHRSPAVKQNLKYHPDFHPAPTNTASYHRSRGPPYRPAPNFHQALATHTLEPFFVPKLQNSFADFPNLHYSISLEAVHLGDLMRLSVRCCPKRIYSLDFSRILHSAPDTTKIAMLCTTLNPISA